MDIAVDDIRPKSGYAGVKDGVGATTKKMKRRFILKFTARALFQNRVFYQSLPEPSLPKGKLIVDKFELLNPMAWAEPLEVSSKSKEIDRVPSLVVPSLLLLHILPMMIPIDVEP